jgi:4'-phosphopantetheinyl transferase
VFATEAHLWYVEPDAVREPLLLDAYDALLSPAERERNRRFVFARHRHQDLVTRALIRTVLSTYCPAVAPGDWQFASGPFGRPEIAAPQVEPPLRFNLSHTDGLVVCLVAGDREVGVDAEDTRRTSSTIDIAERYFSPDEVRELLAWPAEHRHRRFFEYWTLKEAYIKARGLGLQLPLDQFTIQIPSEDRSRAGQPIGIAFGPGIDDDPRSWQLASFDLMAHHKVAVAIRRHQADLILRLIPTLPVPGGRPIDLPGADGHGRTL